MNIRITHLLCAAALTALAQSAIAGAEGQARQEVTYLLGSVASSHCQFNRNGSWYEGEEARAHLQKKFDYLDKRNMAPTAELFIERGASTSSTSGKPYQIRCPGAAPVDSATWLSAQLARYRKQAP
jgi:hypothetical protein